MSIDRNRDNGSEKPTGRGRVGSDRTPGTQGLGRPLVAAVSATLILGSQGCYTHHVDPGTFTVVGATIPEMQAAMTEGRVTSRDLILQYLTRIAIYNDRLNAAITISPSALKEADERDAERRHGRVRGLLHGIPVALKDNIQTTGIRTTGGALAFEELVPPYNATLTSNLQEAGAIVIAKTSMTELANWVAGLPTRCPGTTVRWVDMG